MTENPDRVKRLFVSSDVNPYGVYAVSICEAGIWKEIIVDDYFPADKNTSQPIFTQSNGNELWVLLLEKVWAKIYRNYDRIVGGLPREVLRDLTGAPTRWIHN